MFLQVPWLWACVPNMQRMLSFVSLTGRKGWIHQCTWVSSLLHVTVLIVMGIWVYSLGSSVFGSVSYFWKPGKVYIKSRTWWSHLRCCYCGTLVEEILEWKLKYDHLSITIMKYHSIIYSECLLHEGYFARRYVRYRIHKTKQPQVHSLVHRYFLTIFIHGTYSISQTLIKLSDYTQNFKWKRVMLTIH